MEWAATPRVVRAFNAHFGPLSARARAICRLEPERLSLRGADARTPLQFRRSLALSSLRGVVEKWLWARRLFGGMLADVRRKARWYVSDVSDACSLQCVASFVFLYFALLAPLITFGGLLETKTRRQMVRIVHVRVRD